MLAIELLLVAIGFIAIEWHYFQSLIAIFCAAQPCFDLGWAKVDLDWPYTDVM
jgi:hypothetical protein